MPGQGRCPVERLRQPERTRSPGLEREIQVAASGELAGAEQIAGAGLQIDVGELKLRLHLGGRVGLRDAERTLGDSVIDLRFADAERQRPVAQVGAERGLAEPGRTDGDLRRRKPHVEIGGGQRMQVEQLSVPVACAVGEQTDRLDIGREIDRAGGQRRLQGLPTVVGVGHDAFGDVAVDLDVDIGQRDRCADHVGACLEREASKPAAAGRRLSDPAHCLAQRGAVGGHRAFHHQADRVRNHAVEHEFQRRAGDLDLQARPLAGQRGEKIAEADAAVDAFAAPVELSGCGERAGDRGPSQRQVDIAEVLGDPIGGILIAEFAVLDPDFRKRNRTVCSGLHGSRDRFDKRGPVALAVGGACHADVRTQHHDVGDVEALHQERKQSQIGGEHVDAERGSIGVAALDADIMERDITAGKNRDVDAAICNEVEARHRADLRFHRIAQGVTVEQP